MSHNRRAPRLVVYLFAVPIVALAYVATFATRLWIVLRPTVAALLGFSVIGSSYASEAIRRAPAKPIRAAAALGLAVVLTAPAVAHLPVAAASDPAQAVVDAALGYIGYDYKFGAVGPTKFDCSGLVYAVFKQTGELPRIGGSRMGATAYMRWFVARGRWSKNEADARPGDLVVWHNGGHIGIYVGPNRVVSALNEKLGVRLTDLTIPWSPSQFLLVNWGNNAGGGNNPPPDNPPPGGGDSGNNPPPDATPTPDPGTGQGGNGASDGSTDFVPPDNSTDNPPATPEPAPPTPKPTAAPEPPAAPSDGAGIARTSSVVGTLPTARHAVNMPAGFNGVAIATVNLREAPDATSRVLGWVGSNGYVAIVDQAYSPQGNLYYKVQTASGSTGWVYARWVLNTPS